MMEYYFLTDFVCRQTLEKKKSKLPGITKIEKVN